MWKPVYSNCEHIFQAYTDKQDKTRTTECINMPLSAQSLTQHSVNRVACLVSSWFLLDCPQESPQVTSPWSESMSHLMRKLDRLNLDIEEALSASSSPSTTPCTARKKQVRLCWSRMDCVYFVFTKQQQFNLHYLMVCALSRLVLYAFLWSVCCILGHAF